jgi:enterochelin esterase-like enzyme
MHKTKMSEIVERFKSVHLRNERTIWIHPPRLPSSVENLTVFLDGEFYRDRVGAVSVIDDLGDSIADSWVVFVSMGSLEARWVECPCYPPFAKFIAGELLPWLEARCKMKPARQRTLVGLSYTGLAAAFVAMEHPGIFHRVISQSGSFWWKDCWLSGHCRSASRIPTEFYLDVGAHELHENVRHREDVLQVVSQIDGVRRFRDALLLTGHPVRYVEFDGGHDFAAWRQTLPEALRWALPLKVAEPKARDHL